MYVIIDNVILVRDLPAWAIDIPYSNSYNLILEKLAQRLYHDYLLFKEDFAKVYYL